MSDLKRIDLKIGKEGEKECKKYLKSIYPKSEGYKVKAFINKYAPFDFAILKDDIIIHEYEVKNRSCSFGQYPSLMFGYSKMKYIQKELQQDPNKKFSLLWLLKDNNFYGWDYADDTTQYQLNLGINKKRNEQWKDCVYVYNKHIKQLTFFE